MKKISKYLVLGIEIVLVVSLVRGLRENLGAKDKLKSLEKRRNELRAEQKKLKDELVEVKSPEYLEKVAREELNLVKPGEVLVIVEKEKGDRTRDEGGKEEGSQPNWRKWIEVVLGW